MEVHALTLGTRHLLEAGPTWPSGCGQSLAKAVSLSSPVTHLEVQGQELYGKGTTEDPAWSMPGDGTGHCHLGHTLPTGHLPRSRELMCLSVLM